MSDVYYEIRLKRTENGKEYKHIFNTALKNISLKKKSCKDSKETKCYLTITGFEDENDKFKVMQVPIEVYNNICNAMKRYNDDTWGEDYFNVVEAKEVAENNLEGIEL